MAGLEIELRPMRGKMSDKMSKKPKKELETAASDLIQAVQSDDPRLVAMALQDAWECIQGGDTAYSTDDDDETDEE
jgi:hypothetical protein